MSPTPVMSAGSGGGLGSVGLGVAGSATDTAEAEGFCGILQAASVLPATAEGVVASEPAGAPRSGADQETPDVAASDTEDPAAPSLAALLIAWLGAPPTQTPAVPAPTSDEEPGSASAAGRDAAPALSVPVVATAAYPASIASAPQPDAPQGGTPAQPDERPAPEVDSIPTPAGPSAALRHDTAATAEESAGPAAVPPQPSVPPLEPPAMRETPSRLLAGTVEPRAPHSRARDSAGADDQPDAPEPSERAAAPATPASRVSDAAGALTPAAGATGDDTLQQDTPERPPAHLVRPARAESPAPAPHEPAATWTAPPTAAVRESAPPASLGGVPSWQRDSTRVETADRDAPDASARPLYRGGEAQDAVVAPHTEARSRPADRADAARASLTQHNVDRVAHAVRTALAHGGMEVRLRLHPESLGEVRVAVRWEGGLLSARLEAATPTARDALEGGAQTLRAALQEQGIPLDRLSIGVRTDLESHSQGYRSGNRAEPWLERDATPRGPDQSAEVPTGPKAASDGRLDIRI